MDSMAAPMEILILIIPALLGALIGGVCIVIPFWKICTRVGLPGTLSLLMFLPMVNIGFLFYLAFGRWPAEEDVLSRD